MLHTPLYINVVFIAATLFTITMFWKSTGYSRSTILAILAWTAIQGFIGYSLFYTNTSGLPPRFLLVIGPALATIIVLFSTKAGRRYIDRLDTNALVLLNTVRIPVEIVLYWLFLHEAVPEIMTFDGSNADIFSGITAPIIWYFTRRNRNSKLLLAWNFLCLVLLINIVTIAVIAAPFDFQLIAFEQPNIGVMYFPFIWLPGVIVPLVLFSHLAMIRRFVIKRKHVAEMPLPLPS